jgi:hypothetical protein
MTKNSKIAISAISKNELEYLPEWIDYHLAIGVDQIVLYDNNESPILHKHLSNYIEKGSVEVYNWSIYQSSGRQTRCQADCLIRHKYHFDWIGLIDTSGQIIINKNKNLLLIHILNHALSQHPILILNVLFVQKVLSE